MRRHFLHKNLAQLEKNWRGRTENAQRSGSRMLRSEFQSSLRKCFPHTLAEPCVNAVHLTSDNKLSADFRPVTVVLLWDNDIRYLYRWRFSWWNYGKVHNWIIFEIYSLFHMYAINIFISNRLYTKKLNKMSKMCVLKWWPKTSQGSGHWANGNTGSLKSHTSCML